MALNSNALIDFELAKTILGFDDEDQTKVEFFINSISQSIEQITDRKLHASDYTHYFDGDDNSQIILKQFPINSITEINMDVNRSFSSETELSSSDYRCNDELGIIKLYDKEKPEGEDVIKVTYSAGFTSIPTDLEQAVLETLNWNWNRFQSNNIGYTNLSGDGMSAMPELKIPSSAYQVIMSYRKQSCRSE